MRMKPFRASTTTNPEQTSALGEWVQIRGAFAGVLDEVPDRGACENNLAHSVGPERLGDVAS
jgi:hypothetical protein